MIYEDKDYINFLNQDIKELENTIQDAIDILDGEKEPIDFRDKNQPELLRKLCEHLENCKYSDKYFSKSQSISVVDKLAHNQKVVGS